MYDEIIQEWLLNMVNKELKESNNMISGEELAIKFSKCPAEYYEHDDNIDRLKTYQEILKNLIGYIEDRVL